MIVLQLLIAHLLGDFFFQSNELLKKKYKTWTGTFQHVLIVTFFTALLLFPYWNTSQAWIVVGIIFGVHFVQDMLKVEFDKRFNAVKRSVVPFFVDQLLHISLICVLGRKFVALPTLNLPDWVDLLYFSDPFNVLVVSLLLLTYTFDITRFQFTRHNNNKLKNYHPDKKGMMIRIFAFSLFYLGTFLALGFDLFA
ncbi:MAG: hypothetical protein ACI9QC_000920 [Oceanicoccus sp.]|jgi:hypothetical protein